MSAIPKLRNSRKDKSKQTKWNSMKFLKRKRNFRNPVEISGSSRKATTTMLIQKLTLRINKKSNTNRRMITAMMTMSLKKH